jgi:hypothetical protein
VIRKLVEAQRAMILRANTYLAIDVAREEADLAYRRGSASWMETQDGSLRRSSGGCEYFGAISMRANSRYCRRRLAALRKKLERATATGATTRETRDLRREVEGLVRMFTEEPL